MKQLLVVIYMFVSSVAFAQHTSEFLMGNWASENPPRGESIELMSSKAGLGVPRMELTITEGKASLLRRFDDKSERTYIAPKGIEVFQELVVLNFPPNENEELKNRSKLILAGWKSVSGNKIFFGYFYLIQEGKKHPFNGWPVDFVVK